MLFLRACARVCGCVRQDELLGRIGAVGVVCVLVTLLAWRGLFVLGRAMLGVARVAFVRALC